MIKNIFIPEQIKGYYLFSQKIIGLSVQPDGIYATKSFASGSSVTITAFKHAALGFSPEQNHDEEVEQSIKAVIKELGSYSQIRIALPSALVIFKELTFPFLDTDKIRMVLGYEIEPVIPFPLDAAVFDFIVTEQSKKEKTTTVLVAITQQKHVSYYISLLTNAGVSPAAIVVDILALYSFIRQIPTYQKLPDGTALIDLESENTTVSYIKDNRISLVRSINTGLLSLGSREQLEMALRYDKEEGNDQDKELLQKINSFFNEIQFTFNAFQSQIKDFVPITRVLMTGKAACLNHLAEFAAQRTELPFDCVDTKKLSSNKPLSLKKPLQCIQQEFMVSSATACPTPFNFLTSFFKGSNIGIVTQQLIVSGILLSLLCVLFFGNYYIKQKNFSSQIQKASKEVTSTLKKTFNIKKSALANPSRAVQDAKRKLDEESALWFAFSKDSAASYVEYLQELSVRIDRESLGITIKRLIMVLDEGNITLEGEVKKDDPFKSLAILEDSLKESKLLKNATIPEDMIDQNYKTRTTRFTVKIKIPKGSGE